MSEQELPREPAPNDAGAMLDQLPLTGLDALRTHEDALQRAGQGESQDALAVTHGRVEIETHQLSERVTHEAQERRRTATLQRTAPIRQSASKHPLPAPSPIRTTLLALDGSQYAERALPYAAAFAHMTGCALTLGACAPRAEAEIAIAAVAESPEVEGRLRADRSEHALSESLLLAQGALAKIGLDVPAHIIHAQEIAGGLLALERALGADTLALASHGRQGLERAVLGSVADDVVRQGHGPTLIIPPLAAEAQVGEVGFQRALVPLDGSELSERTLSVIQPLLRRSEEVGSGAGLRSITLLYVAPDRAVFGDAESYLQEVRDALLRQASGGVEITTHVAVGSSPGAIVAWAAGDNPPTIYAGRQDLIIMATHGRGGVGRWLYGSVATYVLAHSEVPVLLMRA